MRLLIRPLKWSSVLNKNKKEGFSIIELIVTISILVIINTLVFASYPKFRQSVSLRKTSQEIASTIYQAQTYALGVKEFTTSSGEEKFPGYGAHFDISSGPTDSFVLFADIPDSSGKGNNKYDGESENVELFKIQTGDRISEICGTNGLYPDCSLSLSTADIIFLRPNPVVTLTDGSNLFSNVGIKIKSSQGQEKTINIWLSGQISVE